MLVHLSHSVHAVAVGDDVVLLDVEGDRYLCLPAAKGQARLGADRRTLHLAPELAADFPASLRSPVPEPAPGPPDLPVFDLSGVVARRVALRDWLRLGLCYLDYLRFFAGRPLSRILKEVRRGGRSQPAGAAIEAAAVFGRLVCWLPVSGQCLVRSFLLMRFIRRSGADARWVFGVRTWPFGAHCWVQAEDTVLDDHAGMLSAYAPVMAV
jgi:hypothetical protein